MKPILTRLFNSVIATISFLTLYGCMSGPTPWLADVELPESGSGFIAYELDAMFVADGVELDENDIPNVGGLLIRRGDGAGHRLRIEKRNDLKILTVPVGEYRFGQFIINADLRLNLGRKWKVVEVKENTLTYLGKFEFVFLVKPGIFGTKLADFVFRHTENTDENFLDLIIQLETKRQGLSESTTIEYQVPISPPRTPSPLEGDVVNRKNSASAVNDKLPIYD